MDRRRFIRKTSSTTAAAATATVAAMGAGLPGATLAAAPNSPNRRLGLTLWSYNIRWRNRNQKAKSPSPQPGWKDALDVLEHCSKIGAGCLQTGVRGWTSDFAGKIRDKRESLGIALEGQIGLPRSDGEVRRFESQILAAAEAGAQVIRTVCLGSRRYETFDSLAAWNQFVADSRRSLERAEPIAAKHKMKLAVENHKDWRTDEFLALLGELESEWIGVNLDFGNNLALLEDPVELTEALAPYLMTTHLKDMALASHEEGLLLSEVPLGRGVLDLEKMMARCVAANPGIWFNLEMITRDPLRVPVFGDEYWKTMPDLPAIDLARTLRIAQAGDPEKLPAIAGKSPGEQMEFEERNVRDSFAYARERLHCA